MTTSKSVVKKPSCSSPPPSPAEGKGKTKGLVAGESAGAAARATDGAAASENPPRISSCEDSSAWAEEAQLRLNMMAILRDMLEGLYLNGRWGVLGVAPHPHLACVSSRPPARIGVGV